jgi:hypothetical protein
MCFFGTFFRFLAKHCDPSTLCIFSQFAKKTLLAQGHSATTMSMRISMSPKLRRHVLRVRGTLPAKC